MNLFKAAEAFDKLVAEDAYSAASTFLAQLDLYDDSKRDGTTVDRRVISVAPTVTVPARKTVRLHDDVFMLGVRHVDSFFGKPIRHKYVSHRADDLANVRTMAQTIAGSGGTDMYAAKVWVKDLKEPDESSELYGFFNLYFSPAETINPGVVVTLGGRLHIVRNSFISAAGLRVGASDELPADCTATISYTDKGTAYNVSTDDFSVAAATPVAGLWHRNDDNFRYESAKADKFQIGDIVMNVTKAAVPNASRGDQFTLNGRVFTVISVRDDGAGCWMLHSRP